MKTLVYIPVLFLVAGSAFAQDYQQEYKKEKFRRKNDLTGKVPEVDIQGVGSVLLKTGDELKGFLDYHETEEWVGVQTKSETRALYPSDIVAFECYDSLKAHQRIFFSLPVLDEESGYTSNEFFELVRQFSTFAIVSQDEKMRVKHKAKLDTRSTGFAIYAGLDSRNGKSTHRRDKIVMREEETIFIARDNDIARPYLEIKNKSKTKIAGKDVNAKAENISVLDKAIVPLLFGDKLIDVKKYANTHFLNMEDPDDFVAICEYYDSIAGR